MIPKPHKSYEEQLELLEGRGMLVDNTSAALNLLKHASYYTLSGYWYPFVSVCQMDLEVTISVRARS